MILCSHVDPMWFDLHFAKYCGLSDIIPSTVLGPSHYQGAMFTPFLTVYKRLVPAAVPTTPQPKDGDHDLLE